MSTWPVDLLVLGIYLMYLVYLSTWSTVLDPNPDVYNIWIVCKALVHGRPQGVARLGARPPGKSPNSFFYMRGAFLQLFFSILGAFFSIWGPFWYFFSLGGPFSPCGAFLSLPLQKVLGAPMLRCTFILTHKVKCTITFTNLTYCFIFIYCTCVEQQTALWLMDQNYNRRKCSEVLAILLKTLVNWDPLTG